MAVLTEEQSLLRDAARTWTQEKSPVSAFRKVRNSGVALGYDQAAFAEMGSRGAVKHQVWTSRWESAIDGALQDLRLSLRSLAKSPGFTLVALLSLALGIGANTAIFTLIHQVLLKNLPVQHPEELVTLGDSTNSGIAGGIDAGTGLLAVDRFSAGALVVGDNPGDFRLDTLAVCSYSDVDSAGYGYGPSSVTAHGMVNNILVTELPIAYASGSLTNHIWQVQFWSQTGWNYTLEKSADLQTWSPLAPTLGGNGGQLTLQDTNALQQSQYYRVLASPQ